MTTTDVKTATAYIRVSTERQASEGMSLEAQEAKIRSWCLADDVELGDVFVDAGISGSRCDNRPSLRTGTEISGARFHRA